MHSSFSTSYTSTLKVALVPNLLLDSIQGAGDDCLYCRLLERPLISDYICLHLIKVCSRLHLLGMPSGGAQEKIFSVVFHPLEHYPPRLAPILLALHRALETWFCYRCGELGVDSARTVAMLIIVDGFWCDLTMHCVITWCLYCSYHLRVFLYCLGFFILLLIALSHPEYSISNEWLYELK